MFSCCGCKDDEAWKHGECFCSCHTYAQMDRQVNDYTKRGEVMNPPESAAQGSEAGNLNMPQRDGTGAVPGREAMGTEAQATQPPAAPAECNCAAKTCCPERNEGTRCWRSGYFIEPGTFKGAES